MNFLIKPLHADDATMRLYHLFDQDGSLVMVADYGSPWSSSEANQYVRFAWPNGSPLAILDIQSSLQKRSGNKQHTDFPILMGDAVYSIISYYQPDSMGEGLPDHYFVVRMEERQWLLLPQENNLTVYDEVPFPFVGRCDTPDLNMLPKVIGQLASDITPDLTFNLPTGTISHLPVMALALAFLLEYIN